MIFSPIPSRADAEGLRDLSLNDLFEPAGVFEVSAPLSPSGDVYYTFTEGSDSTSVDDLLLYTVTDNTCAVATANPSVLEINTGTHIPLNTPERITWAGINAFLPTPHTGIYYIRMQAASAGDHCNGAHCASSNDGSHLLVCMKADYSTGALQLSKTNSNDGTLDLSNRPAQYLYFTDESAPPYYIYSCTLNSSDGSIGACVSTSLAPSLGDDNTLAPQAITFATVGGNQYAYVPVNNSPGNNNAGDVLVCSQSTTGGLGLSCRSATAGLTPAPSWTLPRQIAIESPAENGSQYAYVGDDYTYTDIDGHGYADIFRCTINTTNGAFSACDPGTPISGVTGASGFAASQNLNGGNMLYMAGYYDLSIAGCQVSKTDGLLICSSYAIGSSMPAHPPYYSGFSVQTFDGTQYLYVLLNQNLTPGDAIIQCVLDSDGGLQASCSGDQDTNGFYFLTGSNLLGLNFATVGGVQYAYLADFSSDQSSTGMNLGGYLGGKIWQCPVSGTLVEQNYCSWQPTNNPGNTDPTHSDLWNPTSVTVAYATT